MPDIGDSLPVSNVVDRNIFGSHEIAYECLADRDRTVAFERAINQVVRPGAQVLELGTGTGIMALFAARAGASRVDAYEITREVANIARANVAANGLGDVIHIYEADVTQDELKPAKYDVVIAEMISVGLIEEQLVLALNNVIRQALVTPTTACIPQRQVTSVQLVHADFSFHGFMLRTVQIEQTWQDSHVSSALTVAVPLATADLEAALRANSEIPLVVSERVRFTATCSGEVNAIRLLSTSILAQGVSSGWTQCMNSPAVIPIETFTIRQGEIVDMTIAYEMGGELKSMSATVVNVH
jgi:type I protein arginine methyltransferase